MFFNKFKKELYDLDDCTELNLNDDLTNRYVILKPEFLPEDKRSRKYQLVKCIYGYGLKFNGNPDLCAICVKEINDESNIYKITRLDRSILGFATDSVVKAHIKEFGYNNDFDYNE